MFTLAYVESSDGASALALRSPTPGAVRFPSGANHLQVMAQSRQLVEYLRDAFAPPLEPIDVVLVTAELLTHQHVSGPMLKRNGVDHGGCFADAAIDFTRLVVFANPEYATLAGLLPRLHYVGVDVEGFVADRCLAWEQGTRMPAYRLVKSCERSKVLVGLLSDQARESWNPDYAQMRKVVEAVAVDNVGGNEADARQRESLGSDSVARSSKRDEVLAGWAQFAVRDGQGVVVVKEGRTQIDSAALRKALAGMLGVGVQRNANVYELDEDVCRVQPERRAQRDELLEESHLAELRELRALAESQGHKLLSDIIETGGSTLEFELRDPFKERFRAVIRATNGKSPELKGAVVYEMFSTALSQEAVAESYGVSRKAIRVQQEQARGIVDRIRSA